MIEGILTEGLIYGIMALAVFITFRVLNFADMTVDGSFPLGAAVMAIMLASGANPLLAFAVAFLAGAAAGALTALIHSKLKIPDLLAGILTMTILYSVNLRVLANRANLSLLAVDTPFKRIEALVSPFMPGEVGVLIFMALFVAALVFLLDLFFHTDFGISLGALGSNPQMVMSQGMNPEVLKLLGVSFANGLVGVAGGLSALYQGFADVNAGIGTVVAGLASVMIGEFLIRSTRIGALLVRVILGSIIYRAIMYAGRQYGYLVGLTANDLKFITGALIVACLAISRYGNGKLLKGKAASK